MKDYSRKHYTDHQYRDWMGTKTEKSVWNSILENSSGYGEFSNKAKSSLAASVADYLKQSELKKPYNGKGFNEMEDTFEGPPGIPSRPGVKFDYPWNLQPGYEPWAVVFDLISKSEYCPGETTDFVINGTEPIYELSHHSTVGTTISVSSGYGTNTVYGTVTAGSEQKGSVNINGSMTSVEGVTGGSNYLMPESRTECCIDLEPDPVNTPETINQSQQITVYVIGGMPPYYWEITGDGLCSDENIFLPNKPFYFEGVQLTITTSTPYTTVTAKSWAKGSIGIRTTDNCQSSVTQYLKCTTGTWWTEDWPGCEFGGPAMTYESLGGAGYYYLRTEGIGRVGVRSTDNHSGTGTCSSCNAVPFSYDLGRDDCITWGSWGNAAGPPFDSDTACPDRLGYLSSFSDIWRCTATNIFALFQCWEAKY